MVCSCDEGKVVDGREGHFVYQVTKGACGRVVLDERIGADYTSAFKTIEAREVESFNKYCPDPPCNKIRLEAFELEVADEKGVAPAAKFFGLKVLDQDSGSLLHSVSEVITSSGYLYRLEWCLD